jgi:hypothetical protein
MLLPNVSRDDNASNDNDFSNEFNIEIIFLYNLLIEVKDDNDDVLSINGNEYLECSYIYL